MMTPADGRKQKTGCGIGKVRFPVPAGRRGEEEEGRFVSCAPLLFCYLLIPR